MAIDLGSAIEAWQEAVADAQAAEKLLNQTWHDYLQRRGPPATDGLVKEVARFRGRAEARLMFALALANSGPQARPSMTLAFTHSEPIARVSAREEALTATAGSVI